MAYFIGAIIACFIVSRLVWLGFRRWGGGIAAVMAVNIISGAIAVVIAAYGMADGGEPKFEQAATVYFSAQIVVLIFDLISALRGPKVSP